MNIKQYINNKRQYITPRVRVIDVEYEGVMLNPESATGSAGGMGGGEDETKDPNGDF